MRKKTAEKLFKTCAEFFQKLYADKDGKLRGDNIEKYEAAFDEKIFEIFPHAKIMTVSHVLHDKRKIYDYSEDIDGRPSFESGCGWIKELVLSDEGECEIFFEGP
jgi:hypothetical protein